MDGLPELAETTGRREGELRGWPRQSRWTCGSGLDVGKEEHFAEVLDDAGERLFARSVANDQAPSKRSWTGPASTARRAGDRPARLDRPARFGSRPEQEVPVAYVPGLVMRRAADLYPGEAKTDKRDASIIADTGRTRRKQVHWLDVGSDELLERLRVLNGFDIDLAADQTRLTNRCRDALAA